MYKIRFKKQLSWFLAICCLSSLNCFAEDVKNDFSKMSSALSNDCSKELLLSYFPTPFVNATLKKFNVAEDKWASINQALSEKDKQLISIVEEKAAKINPNLLKDPQQRQAAVKVFRETLLNVFTQVMQDNGISDQKQIEAMLEDIQQQKAKRFAQCMQKQRDYMAQVNGNDVNNNDDDDDDEDDEEDDDDNEDESDINHPRQDREKVKKV